MHGLGKGVIPFPRGNCEDILPTSIMGISSSVILSGTNPVILFRFLSNSLKMVTSNPPKILYTAIVKNSEHDCSVEAQIHGWVCLSFCNSLLEKPIPTHSSVSCFSFWVSLLLLKISIKPQLCFINYLVLKFFLMPKSWVLVWPELRSLMSGGTF